MRVCYFYSADWTEARRLLHENAPEAEEVWTGDGLYDYWHATMLRWGTDDLVTIEQDNGIHEEVIPQFRDCPEPWCSFGYQIGSYTCTEGGGCRKLSLEAQQAVTVQHLEYPPPLPVWEWAAVQRSKGIIDIGECLDCAVLCWRHMDTRIANALKRAGFQVHVHKPDIRHLRMELCLRHSYEEAGTAYRLPGVDAQRGKIQAGTRDPDIPCCHDRGTV